MPSSSLPLNLASWRPAAIHNDDYNNNNYNTTKYLPVSQWNTAPSQQGITHRLRHNPRASRPRALRPNFNSFTMTTTTTTTTIQQSNYQFHRCCHPWHCGADSSARNCLSCPKHRWASHSALQLHHDANAVTSALQCFQPSQTCISMTIMITPFPQTYKISQYQGHAQSQTDKALLPGNQNCCPESKVRYGKTWQSTVTATAAWVCLALR